LGFMFGNVDNSGDLDADYLDEVSLCLFYIWSFISCITCHKRFHKRAHVLQVTVGIPLKLRLSESSTIYLRQEKKQKP
jgi:hypothetical protein